jgi:sugar-specific transcriptional regulator TrmB
MNDLINALKKIGLSDKEAKVYLALLKIGDATVREISSEALTKRPTTYLALEELRQRGLVLKIPHVKKAIYGAKNPRELFDYAAENVHGLRRVLPKIESLATERNPVKTYYYEGLQGLKDALYYKMGELEGKKMTVFWAKLDKISQPILDLFKKTHKSLIKHRISVNGITPYDETAVDFKADYPKDLYDVDMLPKEDYSSNISLEVVNDFLRIIDGVAMRAVIIEDKFVADAIRQISQLVRRNNSIKSSK